jgi:hypothetical protein
MIRGENGATLGSRFALQLSVVVRKKIPSELCALRGKT